MQPFVYPAPDKIHKESRETHFHRPDRVRHPLYVITPVFNPQRYRARWKLYKAFENYVLSNDEAYLLTIEAHFGNRDKALTKQMSDKHRIMHVQTDSEIWLKENLINLAIQRLPEEWQYVAWIDSDIQFARPDWVGECVQQLQHYDVLQMFDEAHDLNPEFQVIKSYKGFAYCYLNEDVVPKIKMPIQYYVPGVKGVGYWHPGFAWAARRSAINHLGGLIDWSVLGGGDTFMAYALAGMLNNRTMPRSLGENGVKWLQEWQNRAELHIRRNIGYMSGAINHFWHGSRVSRGYEDRGQILTRSHFDPTLDLKKDWQGLYQLTSRNHVLRDDIRKYFRRRNEDAI